MPHAAKQRRLLPAVIGLVLGLAIGALNASVLAHELRLRIDGVRVVMTVQRCDRRGRVQACTGTYERAGVTYRDRLLLGGEGAHVGERVTGLVDRVHPGDVVTTGLGAAVEAGLLTAAGLVIAVIAARQVVRARGQGKSRRRPGNGATARRSLAARARVWEAVGEAGEGGEAGP